jgi:mercuric reductase
MAVVALEVGGMTCESCARHVEQALRAVPGVQAAEVSYKEGAANVSIGDRASSNALISAIAGLGYSAKALDAGVRESEGAAQGAGRANLRVGEQRGRSAQRRRR